MEKNIFNKLNFSLKWNVFLFLYLSIRSISLTSPDMTPPPSYSSIYNLEELNENPNIPNYRANMLQTDDPPTITMQNTLETDVIESIADEEANIRKSLIRRQKTTLMATLSIYFLLILLIILLFVGKIYTVGIFMIGILAYLVCTGSEFLWFFFDN